LSKSLDELGKFMDATEFKGAMTTFGYFQEALEVTRPYETFWTMLYRGSAKYLPANHPGADFILPLVLQDGKPGLILVQVKGINEDILTNGNERQKKAGDGQDEGSDCSKSGDKEKFMENKASQSGDKNQLNESFDIGEKRPFDESSDVQQPTASVRDYMKLCTIPGVFRLLETKKMKEETKKKLKETREELKDFPALRIIINLTLGFRQGIKYFEDENGPFLAIQTSGSLGYLASEEVNFIQTCIVTAHKVWEGKLPKLENSMKDSPPKNLRYHPYNPAFSGFLQDNDSDIFEGNIWDLVPSAIDEDFKKISYTFRGVKASKEEEKFGKKKPDYYIENIEEFYRKIEKP
jgi:hypothetical protein